MSHSLKKKCRFQGDIFLIDILPQLIIITSMKLEGTAVTPAIESASSCWITSSDPNSPEVAIVRILNNDFGVGVHAEPFDEGWVKGHSIIADNRKAREEFRGVRIALQFDERFRSAMKAPGVPPIPQMEHMSLEDFLRESVKQAYARTQSTYVQEPESPRHEDHF